MGRWADALSMRFSAGDFIARNRRVPTPVLCLKRSEVDYDGAVRKHPTRRRGWRPHSRLMHRQAIASSAASVASLSRPAFARGRRSRAEGQAHVNIGYFAHSDDLHFYLLSHPRSLHCRNIATNPSMAEAVFTTPQNWTIRDVESSFSAHARSSPTLRRTKPSAFTSSAMTHTATGRHR